MNLKNISFALSFVILAAGCSTAFRVFPPSGKDETNYYADKVECQKTASYQSSSAYVNRYAGSATSGQSIDQGMFFDCLRGKGYRVEFK